jgi:uncharacterized OsmC-like protein
MSNETQTAISASNPTSGNIRDCLVLKARTQLEGRVSRPDLDPLRRVLAALADSLAATYRQIAATEEILLDDVDVRVEAGLDLGAGERSTANPGHLGPGHLGPGHLGPGHLRVEVRLRSRADVNALERLRLGAERHDPVLALLRQAIPTRLEIAIDLRDTRSIAAE